MGRGFREYESVTLSVRFANYEKEYVMRKLITFALLAVISLTSINAVAADDPIETNTMMATLLLGSAGINGKVDYKLGVPDDYGKKSNMWLFFLTESPMGDMDTLAYALAMAVSLDGNIPNKTDYVTVAHKGMMYVAPMSETRKCIKGVGVKGFACAKEHIRAGKF